MSRILITGATGFIGLGVIERLAADNNYAVVAAVRGRIIDLPVGTESVLVKELDTDTEWDTAVSNIDVVVHCAARVHVMKDQAADSLAAFRRVNVEGTLNLARQAAEAGTKRFVFLSSIKVNGEGTLLGRPYTANDSPAPVDPYAISKWEAEDGLREIAAETGMEVVIVRPPLVYGPGVRANFLSMMRWLYRGVPLPLGGIHNRRSLVAKGNLVDLIVACIEHPAAANETFLAGDGEDLSTTDLLQRMGKALGRPARLFPVPTAILESSAKLFGKTALLQRLCGSLQVDLSKANDLLGWHPPMTTNEALRETAREFLHRQRSQS